MSFIQRQERFLFTKNAILLTLLCASMCFGQSVWVSNPISTVGLNSVSFGDNQFMAVGNSGTIMSSPDGSIWTKQTSGTTNGLSFVTYGVCVVQCSLFVATGFGTILTSPDGTTWNSRYNGAPSSLYSVAFGNGQFVAVGDSCRIVTQNQHTWTWTTYSGIPSVLTSVTYGNGLFVAVGNSDTILTSPDGVAWTARYPFASALLQSVTYGNGHFVAVGFNTILTSADGVTWTSTYSGANPSTSTSLQSVTYGDSLFVAVGLTTKSLTYAPYVSFSGSILISPNGVTWTSKYSGAPANLVSVTYGDGKFVALGLGMGNDTILTSKADNIGVVKPKFNEVKTREFKINVGNTGIGLVLPEPLGNGEITLGIFTVAGRKAYSGIFHADNGTLNIPIVGLSTGTYLMTIRGSNTLLSSPFVVTK